MNERKQNPDQTPGAPGLAGSQPHWRPAAGQGHGEAAAGGCGGQGDCKLLPGVAVFLWLVPEDERETSRQKRWWRTQKGNSCPTEILRPAFKEKGVRTDGVSFLTDFCVFQIIFPILVHFRTEP